jgi:hypothetical protein
MNHPITALLRAPSPVSHPSARGASALFLLLLIAFSPLNQSAEALTMSPLSVETLSRDADLIIHGRVLSQEAQRVQKSGAHSEGSWIFTLSTLEVTARLKGDCLTQVLVSQAGGTIDGLTMSIPGATLLRPDQEVVLFLKAKPGTSHYTILGFNQGIRWIVVNQEGRREVLNTPKLTRVKESPSSKPLSDPSQGGQGRVGLLKTLPKVKVLKDSRLLEAFVGEIQSALNED